MGVSEPLLSQVGTIGIKRSASIDFLRVVAIMAVVCVHSLPIPILNEGGGFGFASLRQ